MTNAELTDAELDALTAEHSPSSANENICNWCGDKAPCSTSRAITELQELREGSRRKTTDLSGRTVLQTDVRCLCGDFYTDHTVATDWRLTPLRGRCRVTGCKCEEFTALASVKGAE